jgi:hypothetical protein
MGEIGHYEKHYGAHNLALVFGDEEFMSGVGANLGEDLSVMIRRSD